TSFGGQRLTGGNHTVARHDNRTPRRKPSPFQTAGREHERSPLLRMLWNGHDNIAVAIEMDLVLRLHNDRGQVLRDDGRASERGAGGESHVIIDRALHKAASSGEVHSACRRGWERGAVGAGQRLEAPWPCRPTG